MCHGNRTESPFYLNLRLWYFIVVWILLFWIEKDHILLLDFNFFLKFLLYIFCCQIKLPKHKSNIIPIMISTDFFFYVNILCEILVWLSIFIETLFRSQFYNFSIYHEFIMMWLSWIYNDIHFLHYAILPWEHHLCSWM